MTACARVGFTLTELLVVISVIVALAGIGYPSYTWLRDRAEYDSARTLVTAVAAAIGGHPTRQVTIPLADGRMRVHALWDMNADGWLDGEPALDDRFDAATRTLAAGVGYRGFLGTTRAALPPRNVDPDTKRVIDPWGNVLRIDLKAETYGSSFFGLWSPGPDGIDGTEDDITSWKKDAR